MMFTDAFPSYGDAAAMICVAVFAIVVLIYILARLSQRPEHAVRDVAPSDTVPRHAQPMAQDIGAFRLACLIRASGVIDRRAWTGSADELLEALTDPTSRLRWPEKRELPSARVIAVKLQNMLTRSSAAEAGIHVDFVTYDERGQVWEITRT